MGNECDIVVTAPGEYPPVKVESVNLNYARIISNSLASAHSEMTAIYQYLYQNWTLEQTSDEFAALTLKIAKVEMHHLQMLGELITKLGGNPRCQFNHMGRVGIWNGSMVGYPQGLKAAVKLNLVSERDACKTYETQAHYIKDASVSAVLLRIAEDEKVHIAIWETYLRKLTTDC